MKEKEARIGIEHLQINHFPGDRRRVIGPRARAYSGIRKEFARARLDIFIRFFRAAVYTVISLGIFITPRVYVNFFFSRTLRFEIKSWCFLRGAFGLFLRRGLVPRK